MSDLISPSSGRDDGRFPRDASSKRMKDQRVTVVNYNTEQRRRDNALALIAKHFGDNTRSAVTSSKIK